MTSGVLEILYSFLVGSDASAVASCISQQGARAHVIEQSNRTLPLPTVASGTDDCAVTDGVNLDLAPAKLKCPHSLFSLLSFPELSELLTQLSVANWHHVTFAYILLC